MKASTTCFLFVLTLLLIALCGQTTAQSAQKVASTPAVSAEAAPIRTLTGSVFNELGEPLAGATVTVVGEKNASIITNSIGGFVLRTNAAPPVLRVTYAGYKELEQTVSATQPTSFTLEPVANYKRNLKKRSKAAAKSYKK
jgi:hypothetical protein